MKQDIFYSVLNTKPIIPIVLLLCIISANNCDKSTPMESAKLRPDMRVNDFTSTNYQEGKIAWEIKARESSYYYDENRSIANEIVLNYYEDDKISTVVRADTAIMSIDSKDIDLIGNVDMLSTAGNRLLTTRIKWNNKDKLLDTDEAVKIIKKNGDIIKGTGLRANYNLEDYEIKRNVIAITKNVGKNKGKDKKQ